MTVFAWSALVVFTLTTAALLALLGRALFHALDRIDRVRDEVFSMAKTVEGIALRLEGIERRLSESEGRAEAQRDELRATMRRDVREILDSPGSRIRT